MCVRRLRVLSRLLLGFLFFSAGERRDPLPSQPSLAVGTTTVLCQILQGDVACHCLCLTSLCKPTAQAVSVATTSNDGGAAEFAVVAAVLGTTTNRAAKERD